MESETPGREQPFAQQDTGKMLLPSPSSAAPETILEIASLAVRSRSQSDLFHQLAPYLQQLTGCEIVNFSIYDPDQNRMLTHFWTQNREIGQFGPFAIEDSISGQVWSAQEPIAISDIDREQLPQLCVPILKTHGVRSYTMLPMSTDTNRYGTLGLGQSGPRILTSQEIGLLSRIAQVAAFALENQAMHHASLEREERLQSLITICNELSAKIEFDRLIPAVLENLRRVIQYDHAVLALLEEDGANLRMFAIDIRAWEKLQVGGLRVPLSQALSARAIQSRTMTVFGPADLESVGTPLARAIREAGIQSLCIIPLVSTAQVWGSLNVGSTRENVFTADQTGYLQQVANQIASTFENSRAYHEVAELKERLAGERRYLESEARADRFRAEMIGNSPSLKRVMEHASIVANTNSTVLITGETGTGKERVAHAIHNMSSRRDASFIKLNCAAIPTGLVESELFGHEKGAFTGAVSQKVGRLELADKGTLFLDEIGEIPLELQPKLLRVLQDHEFERLGGTRTIRVDVRLIAATNRDLGRAVEQNEFRRDLFYRLHVFPLHVPPLRDRREDIPLLVRHFVERCSARLNKRIEIIPDEVVEAMLHWSWPGNIRELENFIERSVILSNDNVLRAPLGELREYSAESVVHADTTLRGKEREHIIEVLRQSRGLLSGPSGAAARLGLKRTTLQYKMQKLGISRLDYLS